MVETNMLFAQDEENKNLIDDLDLDSNLEDSLPAEENDGGLDDDKLDNNKEELSVGGDKGGLVIGRTKAVLMKKLLENIKGSNEKLIEILSEALGIDDEAQISIGQMSNIDVESKKEKQGEGKIVEGVFDGENMIGPDGKQYSVPANYASKSKLVEGDILKLIITHNGVFVYKQIGPIDRVRVIGRLEQDDNGNYLIATERGKYRVLTASVTYFKGQIGDEVVILVPKVGESKWAAVENIVKKSI